MNRRFSKGAWWGAFLVTLIGLGASLYLTTQHFSILKGSIGGQTLCNINQYINCDVVLLSPFSEIGTIPLAGLGLLFYIYLSGALVYARIDSESAGKTLTLPFLFVCFSLLLSLGLAYISIFQIYALCIFCSALYLVNILLFFFVKKVMNMKFGEWLMNFRKISWAKSLGYFLIVFVVGGVLLHTGHKQFAKDIQQEKLELYLDSFFRTPQVEIDVTGRPYFGNPNAKIIVAEFSDFECPYCKKAARTLKPLLRPYQDQIKFVFMNYPLDTTCNKNLQRSLHKRACATAYAAYCAGQQDKFWEYHDKAFARQPKFHQASLENIAEKLKLNMSEFKACMESEKTKQLIQADIEQGTKAGVRGTPSVYVNGRKFQPWMSRRAWRTLMEKMEGKSS